MTTPTPTERIDAVWALLISWPIGCSIVLVVIAVWFVATRERVEAERRLYPPPPGVQEWRDEHWGGER